VAGQLHTLVLLPLILGFIDPIGFDIKITDNFSLLELKEINGTYYGPFGMIPALFSMMIPLGIALGMGFYYKSVSKRLKKIRDQSLELEQEFSGRCATKKAGIRPALVTPPDY